MAGVQFSLRKLLLSIAVVVLILSHALSSYRLWVTSNELQELKRRHGILVVEDDSRAQALKIDLQQPFAWRWRVYLPEGRQYQVCATTDDIAEQGLPTDRGGLGLPPGEHEITVKVQRNERGEWMLGLYKDGVTSEQKIPEGHTDWLESPSGSGATFVSSLSFEPTAPCELLRLRALVPQPNGSSAPPTGPSDGLLVWVEPE